MNRSKKAFKMLFVEDVAFFFVLFLLCAQLICSVPEISAGEITGARVLEADGIIESKTSGEKIKLLGPGDFVKTGEELNIRAESWITLVMADSAVRKFSGPATVTIKEDPPKTGGGVLARLGSSVLTMLFSQEQQKPEVAMTTRRVKPSEEREIHVPVLVHPASGSNVLENPTEFVWLKVEGVPLYRISVYSSDQLLWQETTSDPHIDCPPQHCSFAPGKQYYWVVEGLVGNSTLRSKAADFKVLPQNTRVELLRALKEADSSCPDPGLSTSIKVRLCLNLNLYDKALELINSHWTEESLDHRAYMLRAEIKERMGLFEDALFDHKNASSVPATE
jgi:hypothetical protein